MEISSQALYSKEQFAEIIKPRVEHPQFNVVDGTTTSWGKVLHIQQVGRISQSTLTIEQQLECFKIRL